MKTTILRYALALLFCLTAGSGWGQDEYIINEGFSGLTNTVLVSNNVPKSLEEWEFSKDCRGTFIKNNTSNLALKVEGYDYGNTYIKGYAITKPLDYVGDVYLCFIHARTSNSDKNVKLSVSILEGGCFKDNSDSQTVDVVKHISESTATEERFPIINVNRDTKIKFETPEKKFVAIDDVIVTAIPEVILKDSLDNSGVLPTGDPLLATVNTHRTLISGIWNTLCLPFDVTMNDMELALGDNQNIQLRTFSSYADNVMTFANANEATIPAGTPFLVKLNTTVKNPTFHAVTISNTYARTVTSNGVSFVGTYSPITLLTNGTNLFLTTRNTLSVPASGTNTMNGLRAYFVVTGDVTPTATRIAIDDETTTLQPTTATRQQPTGAFNLSGQRTQHPRHGLYVVDGRLTFVK